MTAPSFGQVFPKVLLVVALTGFLLLPKAWAQTQLSSSAVPKFVDPLPIPPKMPQSISHSSFDSYEIAARVFSVPMLSCSTPVLSPGCNGSSLPETTLWGFGPNVVGTQVCNLGTVNPNTSTLISQNCFGSPAPTIFATVGRPVHVKWINDLEIGGHFVTYPSGVKPTFDNHWANPQRLCNNGTTATDCKGSGGYVGPVPLVVHLHGAISASESDGIPEQWNLPPASTAGYNPVVYFPYGSDYCQADPTQFGITPLPQRDPNCRTRSFPNKVSYLNDGAARFSYPNRQFSTTLFFHDHALGVTTENVYMGLVGFYMITGTKSSRSDWCNGTGNNSSCGSASNPFVFSDDLPSDCGSLTLCADGSTSVRGGLPQGNCTATGFANIDPQTQASGCFEIGLAITDKAFNTDGSLSFSENGNMIVVNGKTWPFLNVEPRKYRFRMVIAAPSSRFDFMFPNTTNDTTAWQPTATLTQIGADSGYLPHPSQPLTKLSLMPGERADVIVDFSAFWWCAGQPGCTVNLLNDNGSGDTGQVMQFNIVPFAGCNDFTCSFPSVSDTSCNLAFLSCTSTDTLPHRPSGVGGTLRQVSLFDDHLGTCAGTGCVSHTPLPWDGNVTENPVTGTTEIWEMYDFQDSHPMHLHEAQFEVINRENMTTHVVSPPKAGETGFKDTVVANGGQITRVRVIFAGPVGPATNPAPDMHPGLFAWHCHINPHEDNEMMRPMCVLDTSGQTPVDAEFFCH